jgi:opacity protein-like surface antigen
MKAIPTLALTLGLSASAFAGDTAASAPVSSTPSTTESSLWSWFAGGSVGYLIDNEEEFYTLHLGVKIAETGPIAHSIFLEGAYAEFSNFGLETDILPVTLNYKLDYALSDSFSVYAGAGLGAAFVDSSIGIFDDSSTEFTAQIFAGVGYDVCENFQLFSGARWIWVDDSKLGPLSVDIGDDVGVELGGRLKF